MWPSVGFEERDWIVGSAQRDYLDFFTLQNISLPYKAAVLPQIASLVPELDSQILTLVDAATQEISRFDAEAAHFLTPMPAVLLRSESASSSQLENLTTNARNLALATLGVGGKQNASLVAANATAMDTAIKQVGGVTEENILAIHAVLMGSSEPDFAGIWRNEQVWIGSSSFSPHGADYVAPHHEHIPALINDLVTFSARNDIPALVHTALVHAQFENIHPFTDGNGRTGRVLLSVVMRERGLARHTTIPISAGLLGNPGAYFQALSAYRDGDINPIVEQVSHGALAAIANGRQLAAETNALRETWEKDLQVRSDSAARQLIPKLFIQPVVDTEFVAKTLGISERSALNAIDVLAAKGILTTMTTAKRKRTWQATSILTILDAFAARTQRRH